MASESIFHINDNNFDSEVLNSSEPVLVDFTASWCGPCKAIAPFIDQLADEYKGRVRIAKLDIDESPNTAAKYGIRGVPSLYVFKGGEIVAKHAGAVPKAQIAQLIDRAL